MQLQCNDSKIPCLSRVCACLCLPRVGRPARATAHRTSRRRACRTRARSLALSARVCAVGAWPTTRSWRATRGGGIRRRRRRPRRDLTVGTRRRSFLHRRAREAVGGWTPGVLAALSGPAVRDTRAVFCTPAQWVGGRRSHQRMSRRSWSHRVTPGQPLKKECAISLSLCPPSGLHGPAPGPPHRQRPPRERDRHALGIIIVTSSSCALRSDASAPP